MKRYTSFLALAIALLLASPSLFAQSVNTNDKGVVIDGYDVVAYHKLNKAVKGSEKFAATHEGATYWFQNAANLKTFQADPAKYEPAYGGYCAYAVAAMEKKVPVDPNTFKVVDGTLYLFYNGPFEGKNINTMMPWNEDEAALKVKADENWDKIAAE